MKHVWIRTKNGHDPETFDQGQHHDGPECMICAERRCTGCSIDWRDEECTGDLVGVDWREVIETLQGDAQFWNMRAISLEADKIRLVDNLARARREAQTAHRQAELELRSWLTKALARRDVLRAVHNEEGA